MPVEHLQSPDSISDLVNAVYEKWENKCSSKPAGRKSLTIDYTEQFLNCMVHNSFTNIKQRKPTKYRRWKELRGQEIKWYFNKSF